jgi:cytidine deaminase
MSLTEEERRIAEQKVAEFKAYPMKYPCPVCRQKLANHCRARMEICLKVYISRALLSPHH